MREQTQSIEVSEKQIEILARRLLPENKNSSPMRTYEKNLRNGKEQNGRIKLNRGHREEGG